MYRLLLVGRFQFGQMDGWSHAHEGNLIHMSTYIYICLLPSHGDGGVCVSFTLGHHKLQLDETQIFRGDSHVLDHSHLVAEAAQQPFKLHQQAAVQQLLHQAL